MPWRVTDEKGEIIRQGTKGTYVNNCYFNFNPPQIKQGWQCTKCDYARMILIPPNKTQPPDAWVCKLCGKKVTIEQRNNTFVEVCEELKKEYELEFLDYYVEEDTLDMASSTYVGEDRILSVQKRLGASLRKEIMLKLLDGLRDKLQIHVPSLRDFFREN